MTRRAASGAVPPFGKAVIAARQRGTDINLFIYCGPRCWDFAERREHAIAIPTPDDGRRADWRPIVGGLAGVVLVARGWHAVEVDRLAQQLVRDGAKLVTALRIDPKSDLIRVERTFFKPKRRVIA